jgi:ATP-dependent protease Clp ATPase subunit
MCSFCAKTQKQVQHLVRGPEAVICDACIGLCHQVIAEEKAAGRGAQASEFHCSFCGKKPNEVQHLVSGPRVFICDGCVASAADEIARAAAR